MPWSRLRRLSQLVVFVAFVWLTVGGPQLGRAWIPAGPLSQLDPLVGLSVVIASRAFVAFWAAALLTLALTLVFGRAWCGWICPLGTVLDVAALPSRRHSAKSSWWRLGKYVTLAFVLGAAAVGNLGPMILDPVTIITRPLQEIARPFVGSDAVGQSVGAFVGRSELHSVAFLSLVPLVLVMLLNLVERRFWCRSLCPLGGLLALVSKLPGVRRVVDQDACTSCARCEKACPTSAIDRDERFTSDASECVVCMTCVDECRVDANHFGFHRGILGAFDHRPSRRSALVAVGATGVGLVAGAVPLPNAQADILRPPGTDEARLSQLCVRCGACYGACPTGSLRPSISLTSEGGPWTPMLDERPAHCTMKCNRCAVPCPTDALHTPTPEEARLLGLGEKAEVNRERCKAWARNRTCMACQSACPIAGALIGIERPEGLATANGARGVQVPVIVPELCIGCDLCSGACVLEPAALGAPLPPQPTVVPGLGEIPPEMLELLRQRGGSNGD